MPDKDIATLTLSCPTCGADGKADLWRRTEAEAACGPTLQAFVRSGTFRTLRRKRTEILNFECAICRVAALIT